MSLAEKGRDGGRARGTTRRRERILWPLAHIKNRNMVKFISDGSRAYREWIFFRRRRHRSVDGS